MIQLLGHTILSSVKEYFTYRLLKDCAAYTNRNVSFYNYSDKRWTGLYAYGSAFAQFVYNSGVAGPTVCSGVYNPTFRARGSNGLYIDFKNGRALSTGAINTYVTSYSDSQIISETNFLTTPIYNSATGYLAPDSNILSALYFRSFTTHNDEMCLGGMEMSTYRIRVFAAMKSHFHLTAVADILRDAQNRVIPLLTTGQLPFQEYGDLKAGWNYSDILSNPNSIGFVEDATFQYVQNDIFQGKNPSLEVGIGNLDIMIPRAPRQEFP
jgi:hypothetical protein